MNCASQNLQLTNWRALTPSHALLFLLCSAFLTFALGAGELYRTFAYIQVMVVAWLGYGCWKNNSLPQGGSRLFWIIPLSLMIVHMLAVGSVEITKEMRHILLAMTLAGSIWLLLTRNDVDAILIRNSVLACIVIYVGVQLIFLFGSKLPYGTTKNPHYLAQGCMFSLFICGYMFIFASSRLKAFLALLSLSLLGMLLLTSSRPGWIAFFLGNIVVFWHLRSERKLLFGMAMIAILAILFILDIEQFMQRMLDLFHQITTEERVFIWRDALQMQLSSSGFQWLFGHGLDGFGKAFSAYSTYHLTGVDFNSPHNFFLEVLYLNGIVGLILILAFFARLYSRLWRLCRGSEQSALAILAAALLTANLFFVSITVQFYSSANLIVIAIITGMTLYLGASRTSRHSSP